jgi:hypothetical protein
VALTIITEKSDNGNTFLCKTCHHGFERSGRMTEKQVFCSNATMDQGGDCEVKFVVTSCTGYSSRHLATEGSKTYKLMRKTGWYIDAREETSGRLIFLPPDKAKERGLWHDYD